MKKLLFTFSLALFLKVLSSQNLAYGKSIAELNLKNWNLDKVEILRLDGLWEFYNNKLLKPADFKNNKLIPDTLINPKAWNGLKLKGNQQSGKGYGTYRLILTNVPSADLMLDVYSVQTSCRIFVNDSLRLEIGKPGTSKLATIPANRDAMIHFPLMLNQLN